MFLIYQDGGVTKYNSRKEAETDSQDYNQIPAIICTDKEANDILERLYQEIKNVPNKCKYCGKPTGSTDKDVLCPACRETFGHSFYSEL